MRRLLGVALAGLALAGCGVLDDEGPAVQSKLDPAVYGPARATQSASPPPVGAPPALVKPSASVARALDDGAVAVVDPGGVVAIRPERLETSSDASLSGLRWTRWGADGAEGSGEFRILTCQPTCASGGSDRVPARITLSGVKTCSGRRYFERGEVVLDVKDTPSGSGAQPAAYLRAPC
jgi:hypothetical protein